MTPLLEQATGLVTGQAVLLAARVCPKAPPGATAPVNEITGYVLWGVIVLFSLGVVVGIGAIIGGRIFAMPHASKLGVISIVVVFVAAIGYLVLPGMLNGVLGQGCI
jgi:hypothetical protein